MPDSLHQSSLQSSVFLSQGGEAVEAAAKNKSSETNCFLIKHHFLQSVQPAEPCGGVSVSSFVSSSFDVFSCSTLQWTQHANTLLDGWIYGQGDVNTASSFSWPGCTRGRCGPGHHGWWRQFIQFFSFGNRWVSSPDGTFREINMSRPWSLINNQWEAWIITQEDTAVTVSAESSKSEFKQLENKELWRSTKMLIKLSSCQLTIVCCYH